MSFSHRTVGFQKFDRFVSNLKQSGVPVVVGSDREAVITDLHEHSRRCEWLSWVCSERGVSYACEHQHQLRRAVFQAKGSNQLMVVEEWLCGRALYDDHLMNDCQYNDKVVVEAFDEVDIAVYPLNHRPRLKTANHKPEIRPFVDELEIILAPSNEA